MTQFLTSTLADGPMGRTQTLTEEQRERRLMFSRSQNNETSLPVMLTSAHGSEIAIVTTEDAGAIIEDIDGLMTGDARLPLVVTHQDCVPVFVTDDHNVVAMLHAGWRGVVAGILPNAVVLAAEEFGVPANRLRVHLGPGIRPCHFAVGQDVAEQFSSLVVTEHDGVFTVDLHAALRLQAENAGIPSSAITVDERCTFCTQNENRHVFPSWRRDGAADANMISVAML